MAGRTPSGRKRVDWKRARRLYERDGKSFTAISELFGCRIETVSAHAKAEGWLDPVQIQRETAPERREKLLRDFVERDAETIRANLARKHKATTLILETALEHIERLREGALLIRRSRAEGDGEALVVEEDPLLSLRRAALVVQTVEVVDRSIAGLKTDDWRSSPGGSGPDSDADAAAVRAALAELEEDRPRSRRARPEGPLPN